MTISDLFDFIGETNLIEEDFYSMLGPFPVFSGQTEDEGIVACIDTYNNEGDALTFTTYGNNAGTIFYRTGKYTIGRNCMGLKPKPEYKKKINLKWFANKMQGLFYTLRRGDEGGQRILNKIILQDVEIGELPDIKSQLKELKVYERLIALKETINNQLQKVELIGDRKVQIEVDGNLNKVPISDILSYVSRNDSLSEEGIYNNGKLKVDDDIIKVLSGSTDDIFYGEIRTGALKVHILDNKQGLHIITRGKAGKLTYLQKGVYATNTNAFMLYLKDDIKKQVGIKNESDEAYYLKFLKIYLEPLFIDISSNSDVAVFPLTKIFEEFNMPLFVLNSDIKGWVAKYDKFKEIESVLDTRKKRVEKLFEKTVL